MYRVKVSARFSAAHRLRLADGSFEPLHGHDWQVEVVFCGEVLDETGLLIDFGEARAALDGVVQTLDHSDLNASAVLAGANPSAEHLARAIGQQLAGRIKRPELLESVSLEEEPGCWATFFLAGKGGDFKPPQPS